MQTSEHRTKRNHVSMVNTAKQNQKMVIDGGINREDISKNS